MPDRATPHEIAESLRVAQHHVNAVFVAVDRAGGKGPPISSKRWRPTISNTNTR